ncbi:MAG: hypothetical protein PHQ23_16705 [Candidatus Wallbacteria bacterium]|nr:hypothetical protein [Candidatus Wallbacteria bacterium]
MNKHRTWWITATSLLVIVLGLATALVLVRRSVPAQQPFKYPPGYKGKQVRIVEYLEWKVPPGESGEIFKIAAAVSRFEEHETREIRSLNELVPEYLAKIGKDEYGHDFILDAAAKKIVSPGRNGQYSPDPEDPVNNDNFSLSWNWPLSIISAEFSNSDGNPRINNGSIITIRFNGRPILKQADPAGKDFVFRHSFLEFTDLDFISAPDVCPTSYIGQLTALPPVRGALPGELDGKYDYVKFLVSRIIGSPLSQDLFVRFSDESCSDFRTRFRCSMNCNYNIKVRRAETH